MQEYFDWNSSPYFHPKRFAGKCSLRPNCRSKTPENDVLGSGKFCQNRIYIFVYKNVLIQLHSWKQKIIKGLHEILALFPLKQLYINNILSWKNKKEVARRFMVLEDM